MSYLPKGEAQEEMTHGMVVRYVFTKKPGELKADANVDELELFGIIVGSDAIPDSTRVVQDSERIVAFPAVGRTYILPAAELWYVDEEMGD